LPQYCLRENGSWHNHMHTGPYEKKAHYFIDDIVPWDDGTYIGGVDGNV